MNEKFQIDKKKVYTTIIVLIFLVSSLGILVAADTVSPNSFSLTIEHGQSQDSNFRLTPTNTSDYTLTDNSIFNLSYPTSFSSLTTFQDIVITTNIPSHTNPGTYSHSVFVQGDTETKKVDFTITVPEDLNIKWLSGNETFKTGDSGIFKFKGENIGNKNADITFSSSNFFNGNFSKYHSIRGQEIEFPLQYSVPENATLGKRNETFTITTNGVQSLYVYNYEIIDGINPFVSLMTEDYYIFGENVSVPLNVSDNINVKSVTYTVGNLTKLAEEKDSKWFLYFTNTNPNTTTISTDVVVTDAGNNKQNDTFLIQFAKDTRYNLTELDVLEISKERLYLQEILSFVNTYDVSAIATYEFIPDQSGIEGGVEISLESGAERFTLSNNEEKKLTTENPYKLGITSQHPGHISGKITFKFDSYKIDDIEYPISIRVGNKDLYKDIKSSTIYGNSFINSTCENDNSGFFECNFRIPEDSYIGAIPSSQNPVIFLTQSDIDKINSDRLEAVEKMRKSRNLWMGWSFLFIFILTAIGAYLLWLYLKNVKGYKFPSIFSGGGDYDE